MRLLLDSEWLIQMMEKSAPTPQERIIALFDIVDDWLHAPRVECLTLPAELLSHPPERLIHYLTTQAKLINIDEPKLFAHQVLFMLFTALQTTNETTRAQHFKHAKTALSALMQAQTPQRRLAPILFGFGLVFTLCLGIYLGSRTIEGDRMASHLNNTRASTKPTVANPNGHGLSPMEVSELLTKIEQMRRGSCRFIEAIQIPDNHKDTYINVVVNGQAPKSRLEMDIAQTYLQKVQCTYTPMLMMNSK